MCTLIALHRCFPDAPLIVAANRDEYLDRPTEGPGIRDWNGINLLAPRDVRAGGSWLGMSATGLFGALTNRPAAPDPARRSRGLLVNDTLSANPTAEAAAAALAALPEGIYNPFNLFVSDGDRAFVAVYEDAPSVTELAPGPHVIGNADPNDGDHPKVSRIMREAEGVAAGSSARALDALAEICRSHEGEPGNPLAQTCIHTRLDIDGAKPGGYGTRSSMLYRRGHQLEEASFLWSEGSPCENDFEDQTHLLRDLDQTTRTAAEDKTRNVA